MKQFKAPTPEKSHLSGRQMESLRDNPVQMTAQDCADPSLLKSLENIGIGYAPQHIQTMASSMGFAMDDQQVLITQASETTPVQFLQNWLPGNVRTITAARKIDELVGMTTSGSWEDEQIVQGMLEPIGNAQSYGDYSNVPLSSWNLNFVYRTVIRFEKGFQVQRLENARAARVRIDTAGEKRNSAASALEIVRNKVGFYGYNSGLNLTYGFLNDPSLPAYVTVAAGASSSTLWSKKTALEIIADIQAAAAQLQNQSQDNINPEDTETTLALATVDYQYLSTVSSLVANSVRTWLKETYPKMRVVSAPQLNGANGGSNVFYLYADSVVDGSSDDSRTWVQVVPAKFQALGVQQMAKGYMEDYVNATAGVLLKRPYACVRFSGI